MNQKNRIDVIANIEDTLESLRVNQEVTELRVLNTSKGTASGYFDENTSMAKAASTFDGEVPGVYITLNPVKEDLLTRSNNCVQSYVKQTTSDRDIASRSWLPIDLDPIRASGISSTDQEHEAALNLAKNVQQYLTKQGWPEPILADSGNGFHLLYAINLPNDDASRILVKRILEILDFQFSNEMVEVDKTTYNAARIWKLYGTKACKGDNTKERPHRYSQIIKSPEEVVKVSKEQLNGLTEKLALPIKGASRDQTVDATNSICAKAWLNEKGIEIVAEGTWQKNATKYVLSACPWNEEHIDRSAYVIQFSNGAISAGCHHNSCSQEDWHTLRKKYEPDYSRKEVGNKGRPSQADTLIRLGSDARFFKNELEEAYAAIKINGHTELWKVKSKTFKMWLTKRFFDETGQASTSDAMNQALGVMEMKAMFDGEEHHLQLRVAERDGKFYYDMANSDWEIVEITPKGCQVIENPPILFTRNKNTKAQVMPDFDGDIRLLLNHVRTKSEDDQILLLIYIVTCLIPKIPHAVLVLNGEKGAAKSTSMRNIRQIIDPAVRDLLTMPNSIQDLAISLANNYMPCFDNLDNLSAAKSDLLCIASTGGGFSKRTLFTDDDETLLELQRCPALNGINMVVTRPDLMDRSIPIELERISEEDRKEESVVRAEFEKDKPSIIGGAFRILSKAMAIYPNVKIEKLSRMADFTRWGFSIAEAMGYGGERFLEAYRNNQNKSNEEAISSHPVAAAIVVLMRNCNNWTGTVAELLTRLDYEAGRERIDTNVKTWPKAAHILSRRLKEVKSNLKEVGIIFDIRHAGDAKKVTIKKVGSNVVVPFDQKKINSTSTNLDEVELSPDYDEFAEWGD
ncbi:hypothetical protein [Sediminibacillus halophilus]|uniref:Uncharacterized protein n=1 Tax=Sediminibacillus halophilus TaxID=482461 RepID=A0A1G9T519_9BACI|nr:hypothetical protein [Sediminibacillus halophilus]SDM42771.1 hypothetical protein SAMN05216244_2438 [Sediminibacillus halophilus]